MVSADLGSMPFWCNCTKPIDYRPWFSLSKMFDTKPANTDEFKEIVIQFFEMLRKEGENVYARLGYCQISIGHHFDEYDLIINLM